MFDQSGSMSPEISPDTSDRVKKIVEQLLKSTAGSKSSPLLILTGNPGTGKTAFAREMAKQFHAAAQGGTSVLPVPSGQSIAEVSDFVKRFTGTIAFPPLDDDDAMRVIKKELDKSPVQGDQREAIEHIMRAKIDDPARDRNSGMRDLLDETRKMAAAPGSDPAVAAYVANRQQQRALAKKHADSRAGGHALASGFAKGTGGTVKPMKTPRFKPSAGKA